MIFGSSDDNAIFESDEKMETMSEKLKALGHPKRLLIINLLKRHKKLTVKELQEHLNLGQATTSNHLKILKDQELVVFQRDGNSKYYLLKYRQLGKIIRQIGKYY